MLSNYYNLVRMMPLIATDLDGTYLYPVKGLRLLSRSNLLFSAKQRFSKILYVDE